MRLVPSRHDPSVQQQQWDNRSHFFGAAAEAMRRILIDNARRKQREKHGGDLHRVDLDPAKIVCSVPDDKLLALDEAITRLAKEDPRKASLVELRLFAGLSNDEAARALGISAVTAKRHWRYARAWLHREVTDGEAETKL
jgi:RNA polymerase sigma factor (TIGR02999 family)